MARKNTKSTKSRKVMNTKVEYKNGKNDLAEKLMRRSFQPLFSPKDGKARLTFCGVEHSVIEWEDDKGEHQKPVMKLAFSCLDVTHEQPQNIGITCDYRLSEKNRLGQILSLMGFEFMDETEIVDEEDEFGTKTKQTNGSEIFDFLREKCGLVFKGTLTVAIRKNKAGDRVERPGLWDIDYKSLEPLMKNGEQLRDMMASDVTDETFENPEIAMESESD